MKKFNIKSLLVFALVIVLALSIVLVACNKKNDTPAPEPTPEPSGEDTQIEKDEFFNKLWSLSSSIGNEAITSSDGVAVSLDASLAMLNMKDKKQQGDPVFNIGLKLDLILDRSNTAAHSAARLGVYDVASGDNYFAVYYFLDEPNFVYFDLGILADMGFVGEDSRLFKVQFETDGRANASYTDPENRDNFAALLKKNLGEDAEHPLTIAGIVDSIVSGTGENWTLNTLVQNIAGTFNLDLASLLSSVQNLLKAQLVDEQGNIHIENALKTSLVKGFIKKPTCTDDPAVAGRKIYAVDMNISGLLNTVGSMLPEVVAKYINSQTDISLSFGEKDGAIDKFVAFVGIKSEKDAKGIYPGFELSINNFEIRKAPTDKAGVQAKVGFDGSKWTKVNLNVNTMLNCKASMDVETWKDGVKSEYTVSAYTDIDIISVIKGIVKMVKAETPEARVAAFKAIHSEAGIKVVGKLDNSIKFQLLASCPEAQLSWVKDGEATILDGEDMLLNLDKIIAHCMSLFSGQSEEIPEGQVDDEPQAIRTPGESAADGGFNFQAIIDAFNLIKSKITFNGKTGDDLTFDVIKDAFFDENGLKENWHEFLLNANYTAKDCDDIAKLFGGENANDVAVLIDKKANELHLRATYKNDAGVDSLGNVKKGDYFVDFTAKWDLSDHSLEMELEFNMWDDDENKVVIYDCKYNGSLQFVDESNPELLKSGEATLKLTRAYDGENSVPATIFDAKLTGAINYNAAKDSITNANIKLDVKDGDGEEYFHIYGDLNVSAGKVLVKFTDDGCEYATENATVECYFRENLIAWIAQLDVEDGQLKDYKIPQSVLALFGVEETDVTLGQLLETVCHINVNAENVINTLYTSNVATDGLETETFLIGLNEYAYDATAEGYTKTTSTFHLAFEFRRMPDADGEYNVTYVKCGYDKGEGFNGIALLLDTFDFEQGGSYIGSVPAPSREGATIYGADAVNEWIDKAFAFIGSLYEVEEEESVDLSGLEDGEGNNIGGATRA
jgi:hypothetical protein